MKAQRMTITQISAWIMLVSCGLWAGGILIFAVERTNLWRRMPIDQYVVDFRWSLSRGSDDANPRRDRRRLPSIACRQLPGGVPRVKSAMPIIRLCGVLE